MTRKSKKAPVLGLLRGDPIRVHVDLSSAGSIFTGDKLVVLENGRVMLGSPGTMWREVSIDELHRKVQIAFSASWRNNPDRSKLGPQDIGYHDGGEFSPRVQS